MTAIIKKTATMSLAGIAILLLANCSLYTNTDRQNFNSQAVLQPRTAISQCAFQFGNSIEILCLNTEDDIDLPTTIVRVSR